jgi:hypothetical protein
MIEQLKEASHQVAAHGATDAAVVHLDDLLVGGQQQMMIDPVHGEFVNYAAIGI